MVKNLSSLLRQQLNPKNAIRIQSLIYIKTQHFTKRSKQASFLGYSVRSMALWLKDYGISAMLTPVKEKQQRAPTLGKKIQEGFKKGLNNLQEGF